eukprot:754933-Hanusia_phi.AAC.6
MEIASYLWYDVVGDADLRSQPMQEEFYDMFGELVAEQGDSFICLFSHGSEKGSEKEEKGGRERRKWRERRTGVRRKRRKRRRRKAGSGVRAMNSSNFELDSAFPAGTYAYMSPEQLLCNASTRSVSSDFYSLGETSCRALSSQLTSRSGVLLYKVVTGVIVRGGRRGKLPYSIDTDFTWKPGAVKSANNERETWQRLLQAAADRDPPTPRRENPDVPAHLCQVRGRGEEGRADEGQVICRCLQHDPSERYSCLSDMAAELDAIAAAKR